MLEQSQLEKLTRSFLDVFQLPPPLTVSEWADRYRYLSAESSSRRGKWISLPMQREPMDAVLDPEVESVVLMWSSQTAGKTEIINNVIGYFIDQDPSPMLCIQPTIEMAEAWSKDRIAPMVRDTPRLRDKLRTPKSRDSSNTILHKVFPGGHLTVVGANAPRNLAMRPVRVVVCDEVDGYPQSAGDEGDPIRLAEKRMDTFWDSVLLKTSTPTVTGISRIEKDFRFTDKRLWFCPCPKCAEYQSLSWKQVEWEKDANKKHLPETAFYRCEKCQAKLNDSDRVWMVENGQWRPTAPFNGKRGYHLNGLCSVFRAKKGFKNRLHQAVVEFLDAKAGGAESIKVWTNTFLAETFEEEGEVLDTVGIMKRLEDYGPKIPDGVLVLTAGIDVQTDRIECEIVGWGVGEESWGIAVARFGGNPELPGVWDDLDHFLSQTFEREGGGTMRVVCACIDSGYKSKHAYAFVRRKSPLCWATKGSSDPSAPLRSLPRKTVVRAARLVLVGTVAAKDHLFSRMKLVDHGPRYCHWPKGGGYDPEYFEQWGAEKRVVTKHRGRDVGSYHQIRPRNEAIDMRVNAFVALDILNPNWAALAKTLAKEPEADHKVDSVSPAEEPDKQKIIIRQPVRYVRKPGRSNWMNKWR